MYHLCQCHKDSSKAGQVSAGDFKSRSKSKANVTEFSYSPLDTNRTAVLPQYTSNLWLAEEREREREEEGKRRRRNKYYKILLVVKSENRGLCVRCNK